jgi:hypothetical protein
MFLRNKLALIFLFGFLQCTNAKGQLSVPHSFCGYVLSVTEIGQLNFVFIDSGNCIRMTNGPAILSTIASSPAFSKTCPEKQTIIKNCPLVAYPNPTTNFVNIKFGGCKEERTDGKTQLRIFNVLGQLVGEKIIPSLSLVTGFPFDLSHLPNGTYYINRDSEDNYQTLKIIKFHEK